jgi:RluA family pseudouridine synthase
MSFQIHIPDYILFEDEFILVMLKPAGLMVEPDRNGHPNLLQQVKKYLKASIPEHEVVYAQHIHRIDRPVSGIILFAKQRAVLKNLSEQFAERRVKKYYQALTDKAPTVMSGTLEHWHRKEKKKAVLYANEIEFAEKALLHYTVLKTDQHHYVWNIELHTGKYHQIRAQLAQAGCPIIGDSLYGSTIPYTSDTIALHANKLVFFHPITNEEISIKRDANFKQ